VQIDYANVVTAVAAVLALIVSIYTLRRQRSVEHSAYITLALALERVDENRLIARTSLENRSPTVKNIDVVRLLVCPQTEPPEVACTTLMSGAVETVAHLRDIGALELPHTIADDHRLLMPLHYYTAENEEVADELLTYDAILDISKLTPGTEYAVRMLLYGPTRLHRVVHRAFIR
jgi:hypothetical protein